MSMKRSYLKNIWYSFHVFFCTLHTRVLKEFLPTGNYVKKQEIRI